jgi:hypothetical protein
MGAFPKQAVRFRPAEFPLGDEGSGTVISRAGSTIPKKVHKGGNPSATCPLQTVPVEAYLFPNSISPPWYFP